MLRTNLIVEAVGDHVALLVSSPPQSLHGLEFCVSSPPVKESWSLSPHDTHVASTKSMSYEEFCMSMDGLHTPESSSPSRHKDRVFSLPFLYLYAPCLSAITALSAPMKRATCALVMRALRWQLNDLLVHTAWAEERSSDGSISCSNSNNSSSNCTSEPISVDQDVLCLRRHCYLSQSEPMVLPQTKIDGDRAAAAASCHLARNEPHSGQGASNAHNGHADVPVTKQSHFSGTTTTKSMDTSQASQVKHTSSVVHVCWTAELLRMVGRRLSAALTAARTAPCSRGHALECEGRNDAEQTHLSLRVSRVPLPSHCFRSTSLCSSGSNDGQAVCDLQLSVVSVCVVPGSSYDSLVAGQLLRRLYQDYLVPADRHRRYGGEEMPRLMQCMAHLQRSNSSTCTGATRTMSSKTHDTVQKDCSTDSIHHAEQGVSASGVKVAARSRKAAGHDRDECVALLKEVMKDYTHSARLSQRGVLFVYRHRMPTWDSVATHTMTHFHPRCRPSPLWDETGSTNDPRCTVATRDGVSEQELDMPTALYRRVEQQSWRAVYTYDDTLNKPLVKTDDTAGSASPTGHRAYVISRTLQTAHTMGATDTCTGSEKAVEVLRKDGASRCAQQLHMSRLDDSTNTAHRASKECLTVRLPHLDYLNDALLRVRLDLGSDSGWYRTVWSSEVLGPARAALECASFSAEATSHVTALQVVLYALHRLLVIAVANTARVSLLQLEYDDCCNKCSASCSATTDNNSASNNHIADTWRAEEGKDAGALRGRSSHRHYSHTWKWYDRRARECMRASELITYTLLAWHHRCCCHCRSDHKSDNDDAPRRLVSQSKTHAGVDPCIVSSQQMEVYWCYEMYCKLHIRAVRLWSSAAVGNDDEARRAAGALRETLRRWNNKMMRITRADASPVEEVRGCRTSSFASDSVEERTLSRLSLAQWNTLQRQAIHGLRMSSKA